MLKFSKFFIVMAWMMLIYLSSSLVFPDIDPEKKLIFSDYVFDKDVHLFLYGILAWFIASFLSEFKIKFSHLVIATILISYFYGITDEWHQGFVAGRGVSYYDLLFDVIGASVAVIIFYLTKKRV